MQNIIANVNNLLEQHETPERPSFFQLKHFLIGSEPTNQSKLQCCLRELRSRKLNVKQIQLQIEEFQDRNTVLEFDLDKIHNELPPEVFTPEDRIILERFLQEKQIEIKITKRKMISNETAINELQRKMTYILEECEFFLAAFQQIEKIEKIKPWDSIDVQQDYWDAKIGNEFRMRLLLGQQLDWELVKTINQLPDNASTKRMFTRLIEQQQEKMKQAPVPQVVIDNQGA